MIAAAAAGVDDKTGRGGRVGRCGKHRRPSCTPIARVSKVVVMGAQLLRKWHACMRAPPLPSSGTPLLFDSDLPHFLTGLAERDRESDAPANAAKCVRDRIAAATAAATAAASSHIRRRRATTIGNQCFRSRSVCVMWGEMCAVLYLPARPPACLSVCRLLPSSSSSQFHI